MMLKKGQAVLLIPHPRATEAEEILVGMLRSHIEDLVRVNAKLRRENMALRMKYEPSGLPF